MKIAPYLWCHALRVSLALFLAAMTALFLPISHGAWIPMTVLFVMGTTVGGTIRKGIHRFWGTLIGLVIGTLLANALPYTLFQWITAAIFLFLAYYFRAIASYSYGLFVIPVTITIVVVHAIYSPGDSLPLFEARVVNTLIGLAIALALSLSIFPTKMESRISHEWEAINHSMTSYLLAIITRSGATEAKRELEGVLIRHRLLFYDARYEKVDWKGYKNYLRKIEEAIQLLFALHNALRAPMNEQYQNQIAPILALIKAECIRDKWQVENLIHPIKEAKAVAKSIPEKVIASELSDLISLLTDLKECHSSAR